VNTVRTQADLYEEAVVEVSRVVVLEDDTALLLGLSELLRALQGLLQVRRPSGSQPPRLAIGL